MGVLSVSVPPRQRRNPKPVQAKPQRNRKCGTPSGTPGRAAGRMHPEGPKILPLLIIELDPKTHSHHSFGGISMDPFGHQELKGPGFRGLGFRGLVV